MDAFVEKYQPERYQSWRIGQDFGVDPKDQSVSFAPIPIEEVKEIFDEDFEEIPDFIAKKSKKGPKRQHASETIECVDDLIPNGRHNGSPTKLKKSKSKSSTSIVNGWSFSSVNGHSTNGTFKYYSNFFVDYYLFY